MECTQHKGREILGYCHVCGELGCPECLTEFRGQLYCQKDIRPIIAKLEEAQQSGPSKDGRRMLIARTVSGQAVPGYLLHLNPEDSGFYIEEVDHHGKSLHNTRYVPFAGMKAVYLVRSFDGKPTDPAAPPFTMLNLGGEEIVVRFKDGEIIRGRAWQPGKTGPPRFVLLPEEEDSNNLAVLIEYDAVAGVFSPEEYRAQLHEDLKTFLINHTHDGLSKEEATGDFFFKHHDYAEAAQHYRALMHLAPRSHRIRKKVVVTEYNLATHHTRSHQYETALECIQRILSIDPYNEKAKDKAHRLNRAIQRAQDKAANTSG